MSKANEVSGNREMTSEASDAGAKPAKLDKANTIKPKNGKELEAALENAKPGTVIKLGDGVYEGKFHLKDKKDVTIIGSPKSVLKSDGYGLHLENSSNCRLVGFTVADSKKGIVLDGSNNNTLSQLTVKGIDEEGIHFRNNSSNNLLERSRIDDTGRKKPQFGEGVYIGSHGKDDRSNNNHICYNVFGDKVRAENIDVKANTSGGVIEGNKFNVEGSMNINYADSATVRVSGFLCRHVIDAEA